MITTSTVELEQITRAAIVVLYENLNDEIATQNTLWASRDTAFFAALGRTNPVPEAEEIEAENFYPGHIPSLIVAPIDRYPNVSVICSRATPVDDGSDHSERYDIEMAVEVMVKATTGVGKQEQQADADAAELVGSRLSRTVAAAHACFMSDAGRNLGGLVPKIGGTPLIIETDVFIRKEEKSRGTRWAWKGARLEYKINQWVNY